MDIYVVRHGQTNVNAEHRAQGRKGLPLNEEGIKQAEALNKKFKEDPLRMLRALRFAICKDLFWK